MHKGFVGLWAQEKSALRGVNAIADLVSEGSATSEVKLAMDGVTVEGSGRFPQAQVSMGRLEDSALKGAGYTAVSDFAIAIPGGFASATSTSMLGLNNSRIFEGSETISAEGLLADTTAVSVAIKDIQFSMTLDPSSANEGDDEGTFSFTATVTSDVPVDGDVSILFTYGNGTATWGNDFTAGSGLSAEISNGGIERTFNLEIEIVNDRIAEGEEFMVISAQINPPGANNTVTIRENLTITDDDGPAPMLPTLLTLSVSPSTVAENAARSVTVTATATIDGDNRFPQS